MIYPVIVYGDPVLRKRAEPIGPDFSGLQEFIENLWETMYHADGVGLAAPQVGQAIRVFVIDATAGAKDEPELEGVKITFINPQIVKFEGDNYVMSEGCLSLPEIHEDVTRPDVVHIKYVDVHFVEHDEVWKGFMARVIQHEYDHLEGKLFIDYLSPLRRKLLKGKLKNISKGNISPAYRIKAPLA